MLGITIILATIISVVVVGSSRAYHESVDTNYHSGSLTSGETRHKTESFCTNIWESWTFWGTGAGAYGTAAVIAGDGSWLASDRNNVGYAYAATSPTTLAGFKAFCKNSTPWQVTVYFECWSGSALAHGCV